MHTARGASSSHITNADAIAVLELYRPHEEASKEMQEYRIADFPPENTIFWFFLTSEDIK